MKRPLTQIFSFKKSVFLSFAIFIIGCSNVPTRNSFYPNFAQQRDRLQRIFVLGDFITVKDSYSGEYVDMSETIDGGKHVLKALTAGLHQKGFDPIGADTICSGCFIAGSTNTFRLKPSGKDSPVNAKELTLKPLPFYINPKYADTLEEQKKLIALLTRLGNSWKNEQTAPNAIEPELTHLRNIPNGEAILFVIGEWIELTNAKALGGEWSGAAISGAIFGLPIVSSDTRPLKILFYIVDIKTGELVWSDGIIELVPHMTDAQPIIRVVKRLIERIPQSRAPIK